MEVVGVFLSPSLLGPFEASDDVSMRKWQPDDDSKELPSGDVVAQLEASEVPQMRR